MWFRLEVFCYAILGYLWSCNPPVSVSQVQESGSHRPSTSSHIRKSRTLSQWDSLGDNIIVTMLFYHSVSFPSKREMVSNASLSRVVLAQIYFIHSSHNAHPVVKESLLLSPFSKNDVNL